MRTICTATFIAFALMLSQAITIPTGACAQGHGASKHPEGHEVGNNLARIEKLAKQARYKTDYVGRDNVVTSIWSGSFTMKGLLPHLDAGGQPMELWGFDDNITEMQHLIKVASSDDPTSIGKVAKSKDEALTYLEQFADPHGPYSPKIRHLALEIAKTVMAVRFRVNGKVYSANDTAYGPDVDRHFNKVFAPWIRMDTAARRAKAHRERSRTKHATNTKADEPESVIDLIFGHKASNGKANEQSHKRRTQRRPLPHPGTVSTSNEPDPTEGGGGD